MGTKPNEFLSLRDPRQAQQKANNIGEALRPMPPTWIYVNFVDLAARPVGVTFELILFLVIWGSMFMVFF